MSAVYSQADFEKLFLSSVQEVNNYVSANPGKSVFDIATAISQPYQVVYAIVSALNLVVLPNAATEVHFAHGGGPGRR